MSFPATSLLAALFAVMLTVLGFMVSLRRVKLGGVSHGDAGDDTLRRRIRAHGNFAEYAPLALACVGLLELQRWPAWVVTVVAAAFAASRALHALGTLAFATAAPRAAAMLAQHLAFLVAAVLLVLG